MGRRELSQGACAQTRLSWPRCWRRSGASSGGLPDNWRQKCSGRVLMCTGVLQYRAWGSVVVLMCSGSAAVHCLGLCHCVQSPPRHNFPRCSCRGLTGVQKLGWSSVKCKSLNCCWPWSATRSACPHLTAPGTAPGSTPGSKRQLIIIPLVVNIKETAPHGPRHPGM